MAVVTVMHSFFDTFTMCSVTNHGREVPVEMMFRDSTFHSLQSIVYIPQSTHQRKVVAKSIRIAFGHNETVGNSNG